MKGKGTYVIGAHYALSVQGVLSGKGSRPSLWIQFFVLGHQHQNHNVEVNKNKENHNQKQKKNRHQNKRKFCRDLYTT